MSQIPLLLLDCFNDIIYWDEPHIYKLNDKKFTSTTTLIHHFYSEFDVDKWSTKKALEYGLTPQQVIDAWDYLAYYAQVKGTVAHNYAENLMNRKVFPYPMDFILKCFGYDAIKEDFLKIKGHIDNFYNDTLGKLVPLKTEFVVYDRDYGLSGMVDLLVYNKKTEKIEIWDYKTSRAISKENKYQNMHDPISHLQDCEFTHYSLQLGVYKHIIEKNTGIEVGNCYLVWINECLDNYKIIKCDNMNYEVDLMINHAINEKILLTA